MVHANQDHFININSPGRINIIGEHLDYNGGHVLPGIIDLATTIQISTNGKNSYEVSSLAFNENLNRDIHHYDLSKTNWHNYVIGVVHGLNKLRPNKIKGFKADISSKIPVGAGLSSSAALTCGIARGLNELFQLNFSKNELMFVAQKAEHDFAGTPCGIMDQYTIIHGQKNHLLYLNCDKLTHQEVKTDMYDFQWVLFNTNVKHELQNSAYQERVQETQKALKIIQSVHPQVKSLAQVSMEILVDLKNQFSAKIYNRVLYVVQEQKRVKEAVLAIGTGNWSELGKLLNDTHEGLKNLYEVSCQELDYLVELTQPIKEVYGARMMGGGFGGCTLNLVKKEAVENVVKQVSDTYNTKFIVPCTPIILK